MRFKIENINDFKKATSLVGDKRFYVYLHKVNNSVFYVGKGTKYRCSNVSGRSVFWKSKFIPGMTVLSFYKIGLTSKEAASIEKELTLKYKDQLVNQKLGGSPGAIGDRNYFYNNPLFQKNNGNYGNKYDKNPLSIPIIQLDLNGNFIRRYSSISETEKYGFIPRTVSACCNKKRIQLKGYIFVFESEYNNCKPIYKRGKTSRRKVKCFDLNNNFIKTYDSISQTANDGFNPSCVSAVVCGSKKTHKNHIFKSI